MDKDIVVGLDVGTTKICALVGKVKEDNSLEIIGIGTHPSNGLRKGVVVDIDETVHSIEEAVEKAEKDSGCEIDAVYVGIAGGHIKSFNSDGSIPIKHKEITKKDLERVIDVASAVAIPMDREIIQTIVQEYKVDDEEGIQNPIGMSGVRLGVRLHIITAAVTAAQNIIKCVNNAGLDVCDIILQAIASSDAVLKEDEKKGNVILIDLGGGTTDMAVFSSGAIRHTSVLPLGGNNLTYDLSVGLKTSQKEAEEIKKKYGCGSVSLVSEDEFVEIKGFYENGLRKVSRKRIAEILEPRVEEIFSLLYEDLIRSEVDVELNCGVVITGGSALLDGIVEVAERIFRVPARVGYPRYVGGRSEIAREPMYATALGLLMYGARERKKKRKFRIRDSNIFLRIMNTMKKWFSEVF
ncbi:MAG: cell division protein FtsA [Deltaproteobacteria bacterium]|nr:MAG: cell division protein FtsA [Deltaproteobacteria bacterium]